MNSALLAVVTQAWPYVSASWIIVFGGLAAYAVVIVRRGKKLSRELPPEKRRWS